MLLKTYVHFSCLLFYHRNVACSPKQLFVIGLIDDLRLVDPYVWEMEDRVKEGYIWTRIQHATLFLIDGSIGRGSTSIVGSCRLATRSYQWLHVLLLETFQLRFYMNTIHYLSWQSHLVHYHAWFKVSSENINISVYGQKISVYTWSYMCMTILASQVIFSTLT